MANNNTVTRKDALIAAIAKFDEGDATREVLEKMLKQVSATKTGKTPSELKAEAERVELMNACIEAIAAHPDAEINATWLKDNVNGVRSTQKAGNLMTRAEKEGKIKKVYAANKKTFYEIA